MDATCRSQLPFFQQCLIGEWNNCEFPAIPTNDTKSEDNGNIYSYNVMPLPQDELGASSSVPPDQFAGYILKNFQFKERLRFNPCDAHKHPNTVAVAATAPNRGGKYRQVVQALFYDQQVTFAKGPNDGMLVHVENGAWLSLYTDVQKRGPYGMQGEAPGPVQRQPDAIRIAKQISVPHGNSVLALGSIDHLDLDGNHTTGIIRAIPVIPDAHPPYPVPTDLGTYIYDHVLDNQNDYENPSRDNTLNPNRPLQKAVQHLEPQSFIHWRVTTDPVGDDSGVVTNIPFESRRAKVVGYVADYWLLSKDKEAEQVEDFEYLTYTQTVIMKMLIGSGGAERWYTFPHVTANTVKKVSPGQA